MFIWVYLLLIAILPILFFCINGVHLGTILLIWVIAMPIVGHFYRWNWKRNRTHVPKSLSFGVKSMRVQKRNFKIINFVFARYPIFRNFFKRMSVFFDATYCKFKAVDTTDFFGDPSYSASIGNMYYRHRNY